MRRSFLAPAMVLACLAPASAFGQSMGASGSTPLALDLRKVPVGSWAEYTMTVALGAGMTMKSRWALVGRDGNGNTLEMSMEGGPMAMMGGKMLVKMVLVPDPTTSAKPVKQMIMQMGDRDPMEMPLDMPNMPTQKFQKPDPKKLVGTEDVKVQLLLDDGRDLLVVSIEEDERLVGEVADHTQRRPPRTAEVERLEGEPIAAAAGRLEAVEGKSPGRGLRARWSGDEQRGGDDAHPGADSQKLKLTTLPIRK